MGVSPLDRNLRACPAGRQDWRGSNGRIAALALIALFACGAADARGVGGRLLHQRQGRQVHRPMRANRVPSATAKCRDLLQ